jgi:hypothetical protein
MRLARRSRQEARQLIVGLVQNQWAWWYVADAQQWLFSTFSVITLKNLWQLLVLAGGASCLATLAVYASVVVCIFHKSWLSWKLTVTTEKGPPDWREPHQNAHGYSDGRSTVRLRPVKAYPRETSTDIAALRQLGSFHRQPPKHQMGH